MDLDEKDIVEVEHEFDRRKKGLQPLQPGRLRQFISDIRDYRYLLAAVILALVFLYLIRATSHRWVMIIVLTFIWFIGLCTAVAELFSESFIRKYLAFLVLLSYLYMFYRLFLFVVRTFA
jgi:hypothetical protein